MAEKRRPDTVLLVRHPGGRTIKVEFFNGKHFRAQDFDNLLGEPIPLNNLHHYYRMRVDGTWFPPSYKRMYSQNQCAEMIKRAVFNDSEPEPDYEHQ